MRRMNGSTRGSTALESRVMHDPRYARAVMAPRGIGLPVLAALLLLTCPAFGAPPEDRPGPRVPAVKARPPAAPGQPTRAPIQAPPPAPASPLPAPAIEPVPPERPSSPDIEGGYSMAGGEPEIYVGHISSDFYRLVSKREGWEGVGILDGSIYRGVFLYRGGWNPQMQGVAGQHEIDWSVADDPSVKVIYTTRRTGETHQRWHRIAASPERPAEKAVRPPLEAPPVIEAPPAAPTPGRRPAFGEYVYVEELPEAVTKSAPVYPDEARRAGIEGQVTVQALVLEDGTVGDIRLVKSIPGLDEAAVACVRQWRFKPALSKGTPVAVWVAVPVRFSLR